MPLGVLVAGKGGVGKTSLAAALSLILSGMGLSVVAVDTDSVPNLARALGLPEGSAPRPIVEDEELIEERTGARPGEGWGLFFTLNPRVDDVLDKYGVRVNERLVLLVVGSIRHGGEGCLCPAIAFAKALLSWLLRGPWVVVVDSEAGAEVMGRGLAERLDYVVVVTDPTPVSLDIASRLASMAEELGVGEVVVALNKARRETDEAEARRRLGGRRVFVLPYDPLLEELSMRGLGVDRLPEGSPFYTHARILANYLAQSRRRRR